MNDMKLNGARQLVPAPGDDALRIEDRETRAEIERLRQAIAQTAAYRDRMLEPPTNSEVAARAIDRMWRGNGAYALFMLVIVAFLIMMIWFPWSNFPIFLTPALVIAPAFLIAFARERSTGEQSSRAWRDGQAMEAQASIDDIERKLARLGASPFAPPSQEM